MNIFEADPENNPEEEAELTYRLQRSVHNFNPNAISGRCIEEVERYCYEHQTIDWHHECGLPSYSVLHYDDNPFSEGNAHWHGGGDCMCFENDPW